MALANLLIHTVTIQKAVETKNAGFVQRSWIDVHVGVRARVDVLKQDAIVAFGRLGLPATHKVYFDTDYSLGVENRVVWNGGNFEVKGNEPVYRTNPEVPFMFNVLVERKA